MHWAKWDPQDSCARWEQTYYVDDGDAMQGLQATLASIMQSADHDHDLSLEIYHDRDDSPDFYGHGL